MVLSLFTLLAFLGGGIAEAKISKASGPFKYRYAGSNHDFYGSEDRYYNPESFVLCAPDGDQFPTGRESAGSTIKVFDIKKVGDVERDPIDPVVKVPLDSLLGVQIVEAFGITPSSYTFSPGTCVDVSVTISNPKVSDADYGIYIVTIKSHSPGSGLGAGPGTTFILALWPPLAPSDTTPPVATISKPTAGSSHILGPIDIGITASDPVPGTGVAGIGAIVSSLGGAVNQGIILTTDTPKPAGETATGTGTFTPTGGTDPTWGTRLDSAFDNNTSTANPRSGTGTYTLVATATDGASNPGTASSTFYVKYNVNFTTAEKFGGNKAKFHFTVRRSDDTFMYDKTVVVKLFKQNGEIWSPVGTNHPYGTVADDIKNNVQIDATVPEYKTQFHGLSSGTYKAEVWFMDVDGTEIKQAESNQVTI